MTVDRPASTPPPARPSAAAPSDPLPGLGGLRTHLDRFVRQHRLRSLVVVVDDPDLGRQAFRAGAGTVEGGLVAAGPGVTTDPPLPPGDVDADMLMALCSMSLHLQLLGEIDEPDDIGELALRRLPGVYAVAIERDGDVTMCHVFATADAPEDVARRAAEALTASTGAKVVVELRRDAVASPAPSAVPSAAIPGRPVPSPRPTAPRALRRAAITASIQERFADATWSDDAATWRADVGSGERRVPADVPAPPSQLRPPPEPLRRLPTTPTLLAVRSVPEDGEIEVHLAVGIVRAVGRAPLARGLAGAAEAVLIGMSQLDPATAGWIPAWVRTVETTSDGRFVVATSLSGTDGGHRHGIATGASPIEAAARATAVAMDASSISATGVSPDPQPGG